MDAIGLVWSVPVFRPWQSAVKEEMNLEGAPIVR
jgi:hypothetical protein